MTDAAGLRRRGVAPSLGCRAPAAEERRGLRSAHRLRQGSRPPLRPGGVRAQADHRIAGSPACRPIAANPPPAGVSPSEPPIGSHRGNSPKGARQPFKTAQRTPSGCPEGPPLHKPKTGRPRTASRSASGSRSGRSRGVVRECVDADPSRPVLAERGSAC